MLVCHDERTRHPPVNLRQALASFSDIYSPRIVGRVNDYDVRIAHARGEHLWHVHEDTDEFFLVLDGTFDVSLREDGAASGQCSCTPGTSSSCRGAPSTSRPRPAAPILMFEPSGTLTTGTGTRARSPATSTAPRATTSPASGDEETAPPWGLAPQADGAGRARLATGFPG